MAPPLDHAQALRESEERAAFVRRAAGVGFWYCDLPFDVLQWDDLVKAHFHLPPDAPVTIDTFYERIHPDDREPTRRAIVKSIADRAGYDTVYRTVDPDTGAVRHIRAIGRTFYAADGTPTRFDGVTMDVTAEREAEAAARGAEARALNLLESIGEGFVVLDADWNFAYVNAAFERMNDVRREDLLGQNHWEVYPRTVGTPLEAHYRRVLATGETVEFESHYEPWDRWYAVKAYPAAGGGLCVQVRDVTAAKWADAALRESEERYRTLFSSIDEGFCVLEVLFDGDGRPADYRFVEYNPAFERHTGLTNALGRTARELVPDLDPFWFETYGRVATTGEPTRFVQEAPAMGRWFDVYAFRLGGDGSRRVALLFNDITDRQRTEQALREGAERLRLAVEIARMGTFEIDLATDTVTVNEPGRAIYGWPSVHTTFADVQAHFHPDDKADVLARVEAALDPAGPGEFEVEPLPAELDLAGGDPGHVEQVVHQPAEVPDLPVHHPPDLVHHRRWSGGAPGTRRTSGGWPSTPPTSPPSTAGPAAAGTPWTP